MKVTNRLLITKYLTDLMDSTDLTSVMPNYVWLTSLLLKLATRSFTSTLKKLLFCEKVYRCLPYCTFAQHLKIKRITDNGLTVGARNIIF